MRRFTSNIQKGGALLDDARRIVEVWSLDHDGFVRAAVRRAECRDPG